MSINSEELLAGIYNAFNPKPLNPEDSAYVDCQDVRGDVDIIRDLGKTIRISEELTYQLYSGYRGAGKTTELLRLKKDLENRGFFVVYFAADEEDLSIQDAQYADILLACTRNLLKQLSIADPAPISDWVNSRLVDLQDFVQGIKFDKLSIESQLSLFAKLTASIRSEPSQRQKIREKVDPHTETLIESINKFLVNAREKLPEDKKQIVILADNLDRIVPIFRDKERSNHEEIFLDRHEQLQAIDCHIVYTVPISMIYSKWATDLKDNYGIPLVLPSVMVQDRDGNRYEPGLNKLKEAIKRRIDRLDPNLDLEKDIFASAEDLDLLCRMSGGYMRDLIQLVQTTIKKVDTLPISKQVVIKTIGELRTIYKRAVEEFQWKHLADVHKSKKISNDNAHRSLLFNRCLLEYRSIDSNGDETIWYDVHPVIKDLPEFQELLTK